MERRIVPRSEWRAAAPRGRMDTARYPMAELWLHHSYTVPTQDPLADARQVQQIAFDRGYSDISYTFLVHPSGVVLEGRELRYVGAHTLGRNEISLAINLIGNYQPGQPLPDREVSDEQIASVRWLCDKLIADRYLVPGRYPTGGHRENPVDPGGTQCPGDRAMRRLPEMRLPAVAADPWRQLFVPVLMA